MRALDSPHGLLIVDSCSSSNQEAGSVLKSSSSDGRSSGSLTHGNAGTGGVDELDAISDLWSRAAKMAIYGQLVNATFVDGVFAAGFSHDPAVRLSSTL